MGAAFSDWGGERASPAFMQGNLREMAAARLRLARDFLDLKDRLRPSSLGFRAAQALQKRVLGHRDRPKESTMNMMHKYCAKYETLAKEHPFTAALIGLGLGLALALGIGKGRGLARRAGHDQEEAAHLGSETAPRSRSGMHGRDLLQESSLAHGAGSWVAPALGGLALVVGGLLLSGRLGLKK